MSQSYEKILKKKPEDLTSEDVQAMFDSFMLIKDRRVVRLLLAVIIGNQITRNFPIWTMFVAPPSSGKTTLLNAINDLVCHDANGEPVNMIHNISDLTTNSFASGMKRADGETSLLHRMPYGGMMVFKDFTSVLSKGRDDKTMIMGQLREIYDGSYTKRTGNNNDVSWQGKLGALAGVTHAVYQHLESLSVMGDRFMFYEIEQPNRKELLRFKIRKQREDISEYSMMPHAKTITHQYLQKVFDNIQDITLNINEEIENEFIEVADFCTMVRSGIVTNDYTGEIQFVPPPEMPARVFDQMIGIGSAFALMDKIDNKKEKTEGVEISNEDFETIYKIAFDSIPVHRRIALKYLTKYKNGVTTGALARKIDYPNDVIERWLTQLNAIGVIDREWRMVGGNVWKLKKQYRNIMTKLQHVQVLNEELTNEGDIAEKDVEKQWEEEKQRVSGDITEAEAKEIFENF